MEEVAPGKRKVKTPVSRVLRKPIRMMAGREKFDFVGAFCDALVTGLKWESFFDLAPSVKRDICHLLVQELAKGLERGKGKGKGKVKAITVDVGVGNGPTVEEEEESSLSQVIDTLAMFLTSTLKEPLTLKLVVLKSRGS